MTGKRLRRPSALWVPWALWALWFAMLVATPDFFVGDIRGPAYSKAYACVAAGLAAGLLVARWMHSYFGRERCVRPVRMCAIAAFVATLAFCAFDWATALSVSLRGTDDVVAVVFGGGEGGEAGAGLALRRMLSFATLLSVEYGAAVVALCALACACAGYVLADARAEAIRGTGNEDGADGEDGESGEGGASPGGMPSAVLPALCFLFGLFAAPAGVALLPSVVMGGRDVAYSFACPPAAMLVPFALVLAAVAALSTPARHDGSRAYGRPSCPASGGVGAYERLVDSYAFGVLSWNLVTRVVPLYGAGSSRLCTACLCGQCLVVAGIVAVRLLVAKRRDAGEREECDAAAGAAWGCGSCDEAVVAGELAGSYGLSEREADAVRHAVSGLHSAEIGAAMGVSASTVRTYLHRAYRKVGVEDLEGLKELLLPQPSEPSAADAPADASASALVGSPADASASALVGSPIDSPTDAGERDAGGRDALSRRLATALPSVSLASCVLAFATILLPHFAERWTWGVGRGQILGFGYGLVLWALLGLVRSAGAAGPCVRIASEGLRRVLRTLRLLAGCLVTALSGGVLALGAFAASGVEVLPIQAGDPALFFAAVAFAFALCAVAVGAFRGMSGRGAGRGLFALALACVAAAASFADRTLWIAAAVLSVCLLTACGVLLLRDDGPVRRPSAKVGRGPRGASRAIVWCALGFAWEETWRAPTSFSCMRAIAPFLLAISLLACVLYVRREGDASSRAVVALLASGASLSYAIGSEAALFVATLVLVAFEGFAKRSVTRPSPADVRMRGLWFGAGAVLGEVLVDMLGDVAAYKAMRLAHFGGFGQYSATISVVVSMIYLVACVAFYRSERAAIDDEKIGELEVTGEDRMLSYLKGRGLNESQSRILLEVARGSSSAQISEKLNYARGTVNSARDAGYRLLSVHSRSELVALLSREAGM